MKTQKSKDSVKVKKADMEKAAASLQKAPAVDAAKPESPEKAKNAAEPAVFSAPRILALEVRFFAEVDDLNRDSVESVRILGGILAEARKELTDSYENWVARRLQISRRTAYNYEGIAIIASKQGQLFDRWKILGVSKWYTLVKVDEKRLPAVLQDKLEAELRKMTDAQFSLYCESHFLRRKAAPAPEKQLQGFSQKFRSWQKQIMDMQAVAQQLRSQGKPIPNSLAEDYRKLREAVLQLDLLLGDEAIAA